MVHPSDSLGSFIVDVSLRFSVSFLMSSTMECDFLLENPTDYSNAGIRQGREDLDCSAWRRGDVGASSKIAGEELWEKIWRDRTRGMASHQHRAGIFAFSPCPSLPAAVLAASSAKGFGPRAGFSSRSIPWGCPAPRFGQPGLGKVRGIPGVQVWLQPLTLPHQV